MVEQGLELPRSATGRSSKEDPLAFRFSAFRLSQSRHGCRHREGGGLNRLLWAAILAPSAFVIGVTLASYFPHTARLLSHAEEHVFLAAAMIAGIIPFSFLMVRIFRRIEGRIITQNELLSRRTREMEALLKVGQAAEESLELGKILPASLEAVLDATTAEYAEVWLLDADGSELTLRHQRGADISAFSEIARFEIGRGYPGLVAESAEPILSHDLPKDSRFLRKTVVADGFRTFYALPLRRAGHRVIGVLCVAAHDPGALAAEDEQHLLRLMTDHIAAAVENAQLHEEVETLAILTERDRLAREMHDGLAQVLGYVNTKAQAVKELLKASKVEDAIAHMDQLEASARETYDDVREGILALASDGRKRPLLQSLREYAERFSEMSGLHVDFVAEGSVQGMNPGVEIQLLRIVQESLTNIRKHSQAAQAWVRFKCERDFLRVEVRDNGKGFDPSRVARGPRPHLGIQSMRERASAIGAAFAVNSQPGAGTEVSVELPWTIQ